MIMKCFEKLKPQDFDGGILASRRTAFRLMNTEL